VKSKDNVDLGSLSVQELRERADSVRKSLFSLRMDLGINKLKNFRSIRSTRRELARVLTFVSMKNKAARKAASEKG
jgi:ribosomal protein L29